MAQKALIIEDDFDLADTLKEQLTSLGYLIDHAADGKSGLEKALADDYKFIVMDLTMPKLEGTEVCRLVKKSKPAQPIIILSAKLDELSKVLLLELGADDYLTKPFSLAELKARIKAVLRRTDQPAASSKTSGETIVCGDLVLELSSRTVALKGQAIEFTSGEFDILTLLASQPGRVFNRSEIISALHGTAVRGYDAAVTSHINRIRSKLEPDPAKPIYLQTVHGAGYRMMDPNNK